MSGPRIVMANGEKEQPHKLLNIPGKNTGRLQVCKSGNCYVVLRDKAWFMFDAAEQGIGLDDRPRLLMAYNEANLRNFAEAIQTSGVV